MNIEEVAARLGVSTATVSNALSGRGRMKEETRQMVLDAAREWNFVPNPHARRMRSGRSQVVALHAVTQTMLQDSFLIEFTKGVQNTLAERDYGLLLDIRSRQNDKASRLAHWVASSSVDAVIAIAGLDPVEPWLTEMASAQSPVVVWGDLPEMEGIPHVGRLVPTFTNAAREVARYLVVSLNHRKIGLLDIPKYGIERTFRAELQAVGADLPSKYVVSAGFSPLEGAQAFRRLMSQPDPPTAIFARRDDLALGAFYEAKNQGIRIPEDLSLVGHDDLPIACLVDPPLTTVHLGCSDLGTIAANMVMQMLDDPQLMPVVHYSDSRLVLRGTTAQRPGSRPRSA